MRFFAALAGVLVAVPPLIFWIGAQTFIRPLEKALALGVTIVTGALLLASAALLFTPSVQRLQGVLLVATVTTLVAVVMGRRLLE